MRGFNCDSLAGIPATYTEMNVLMEQDNKKTLFRYLSAGSTHTLQTADVVGSTETPLTEEIITYTSGNPATNAQDRIRTVKTATLSAAGVLGAPIVTSRTVSLPARPT